MLGVYNHMTLALAISGLVSLGISMSPELMASIWGTPFKWVAIFLPVVLSFGIPFVFDKITVRQAQIAMGVFAAAMGLSLSSIFMIFKLGSYCSGILHYRSHIWRCFALWLYYKKRLDNLRFIPYNGSHWSCYRWARKSVSSEFDFSLCH